MRTTLAEKLLVKIMDWSPEEVAKESTLILALADYKYNEYHQYSPGMRFIGSLVRWLEQFNQKERKIAYEFIKKQLIFFSGEQMIHLVNLLYPELIQPILIKQVANDIDEPFYKVKKITNSDAFKKKLRRTLFVGLSDGAKMDQFRRGSPVSNEQVLPSYDISPTKADDMINELKRDTHETDFNSIFLIDDFTASGTSYFRYEKDEEKYSGKIHKFLKSVFPDTPDPKSKLHLLVSKEKVTINVLFHVATQEAIENLNARISEWLKDKTLPFSIEIDALQIISTDIKTKIIEQGDLVRITEKYFVSDVNDRHWQKAKNKRPYLGYNECALPVVLNHNTPNNSLPILWLPENKSFRGVFPRVSRHR